MQIQLANGAAPPSEVLSGASRLFRPLDERQTAGGLAADENGFGTSRFCEIEISPENSTVLSMKANSIHLPQKQHQQHQLQAQAMKNALVHYKES